MTNRSCLYAAITISCLFISTFAAHCRAEDISSLLNQATQACSEAESVAGQSFGCMNFGSLYASLNQMEQMGSMMGGMGGLFGQTQASARQSSPMQNGMMGLFNAFMNPNSAQSGQMMQQGMMALMNSFTQPSTPSFQPQQQLSSQSYAQQQQWQQQQTQEAQFREQERVRVEQERMRALETQRAAERQTRMEAKRQAVEQRRSSVMNLIHSESLKKSDGPYYLDPYHSQRNPSYSNPEEASFESQEPKKQSGDLDFKDSGEVSNEKASGGGGETKGSTPFFGLGGTPKVEIVDDTDVVDLREDPALGQSQSEHKELLGKDPQSFDFDGTGKGDNEISFKQLSGKAENSYSVSSTQADTAKSFHFLPVHPKPSPAQPKVQKKRSGSQAKNTTSNTGRQALQSAGERADVFKQAADSISHFLKGRKREKEESQKPQPVKRENSVAMDFKNRALRGAIDKVAGDPQVTGPGMCNFFVSGVAKELDIPYFRRFAREADDPRVANQMHAFLKQAVRDPNSGWKEIPESDLVRAQKLANEGRFVAVAARHKQAREGIFPGAAHPELDNEGHTINEGHIAIVAPQTMDRDKTTNTSQLPWVRDSKHPTQSVRANHAFGSLKNTGSENAEIERPIWVVYCPPSNPCE